MRPGSFITVPRAAELSPMPSPPPSQPESPSPYLRTQDKRAARLQVFLPPTKMLPDRACSFYSHRRKPWRRSDQAASKTEAMLSPILACCLKPQRTESAHTILPRAQAPRARLSAPAGVHSRDFLFAATQPPPACSIHAVD